jgi:ADP-heptose:LPS heptosyltransferase/predicted SAM-dependent methyltransferase
MWKIDDPQGDEASKIRWELVEYTNGRGLDLGCGQFKAFPHFIGVDNGHHWGMKGVDVHVDTCEKLDLFATDSMDFIFSSHLLEHITDFKSALKEWFRVIKPNGYLCLYLPHKDHYPNVGEEGANPDHKQDFMPEDIIEAMKDAGNWDLVRNETRSEEREYSFFQVYQKLGDEEHYSHKTIVNHKYSYKNPRPNKTAAVIRYGAFGDLIQASAIVCGLKKQGYHVTLYTTKEGHGITKNDPNIDKFIIQGKDQVPNAALPSFWETIEKKYDKFVNLSESVEGALLAIPGRSGHLWPHNLRHSMLNRNYAEFANDLAEIPQEFNQRFYPTDEEKLWAQKERKAIGGKIILWSLAGSAIHKTWPYLDTILARLMIETDVKVVLVGDVLCQLLEQGWEKEPRVFCKSGIWTIRESLSFARVADLVIGSETGVLNAVGMEEVEKIVMLSHSSVENLTKHWKNTQSLEPKTSCYPCHKMHYNFDYCKRDETSGVAQCQADITPDEVYSAIQKALG